MCPHMRTLVTLQQNKAQKTVPTYEDFGARSRYLRHALVITSHSKLWDVITYACLRYLLLVPKCSTIPWTPSEASIRPPAPMLSLVPSAMTSCLDQTVASPETAVPLLIHTAPATEPPQSCHDFSDPFLMRCLWQHICRILVLCWCGLWWE